MDKFSWFLLVILVSFSACNDPTNRAVETYPNGDWLGKLHLSGGDYVPFNFSIQDSLLIISNSTEHIPVGILVEDSLRCHLPVFGSNLVFKVVNRDEIRGFWHKEQDNNMSIFFSATRQLISDSRFNHSSLEPSKHFQGKWKTTFAVNKNEYPAIGIFEQDKNVVTGTFLTETGDYRYLEGNAIGDSLFLSCFDGAHAFLFAAEQFGDSLSGIFRSGKNYIDSCWVAVKNDSAELSNPDSLSYILANGPPFSFSFPGINTKTISYSKEAFLGSPVIIQLFGSWCPNCADECRFLSDLYNEYRGDGLEIFGLAFEKKQPIQKQKDRLSSYVNALDIPYPIGIAGGPSKSDASKMFPQINSITSFPTCLFIDKSGKVARVHTGFYGPGTGDYYTNFVQKTREFVRELLAE